MKNHGLIYAVSAYTIWGVVPIYWKQLAYVDSFQIVVHRMLWSCVLVLLLIVISRQWQSFSLLIRQRQLLFRLFFASILISLNSAIFIWAINAGYIIEVSMGYFINPLIQVLFGVAFFSERLRPTQWSSIVIAALGVSYLVYMLGSIPVIALSLAVTFACYAAIKKTVSVPAQHGLAIETAFLMLPAIAYLFYLDGQGRGVFGQEVATDIMLIVGGLFTLIPMILFSAAAKKISMTALGMSQYIGPSLQLGIGVFVYHESFDWIQGVSFGLIWLALIIYVIDQLKYSRSRKLRS